LAGRSAMAQAPGQEAALMPGDKAVYVGACCGGRRAGCTCVDLSASNAASLAAGASITAPSAWQQLSPNSDSCPCTYSRCHNKACGQMLPHAASDMSAWPSQDDKQHKCTAARLPGRSAVGLTDA
jgi:hypothetical protein